MSRTLFNKIFVFLFLFSLPLVLAVTTVQTDSATYKLGSTIAISGTCSSPNVPVGLFAIVNPDAAAEKVWFDQVTTDVSYHYTSSFVPTKKGSYNIVAACQGDSAVITKITVTDTVVSTGGDSGNQGGSSGGNNGGGGGGSSGGSGCTPNWQYSQWSYCDANLQQTRTALVDKEHCANAKPKEKDLVHSCDVCEESWSCQAWSECDNGQQQRNCFDDHACGTTLSQPVITQSCTVSAPHVVGQTLPPSKPFFTQVGEKTVSFWDNYMYWIIGIPLGIIIFFLLILLFRLLFKKKLVYDEKEIRDWVKKERSTGTSMDDVKQIIEQYTHWDKEHVEKTVGGIK